MGSESQLEPDARGERASYETLLPLGQGGMGSALLARTVGLAGFERLVVIKRLRPELHHDERSVGRFLAEARIAASIHHANVVATQHVGVDEQGPYLVLDYVEGASLEQLLNRSSENGGPVPVPICLRIALDALLGLDAVHEARDSRGRPLSILHRDISLQNVLVGRDGVTRISDFGIAKSAFATAQTEEGYLVGKLQYLPPEYLRREPTGATMDIYSLGVTLWLALTDRDPWPGASEAQVMHEILTNGLPPASSVISIAPEVERLIARACALKVKDRFPSARAMADEIERIARDTGWLATQREVAEWLESLVGEDLEYRRKAVASLLAERGSLAAPPAHGPNATTHELSHDAADVAQPPASSRREQRFGARELAIAAIALVGLAVVASFVILRSQGPSSAPPAPSNPSAPTMAEPVAEPRSPEPMPEVTPEPAVSAAEPAPSSEPAPSATPPARAPRPPAARAAGPKPIDQARAPDDIKAKNPYRRAP